MNPIRSVEQAIQALESYDGKPEDFVLVLSDELLDPFGARMAIICDFVLRKDWEPDVFEQKDGYRICRFKIME